MSKSLKKHELERILNKEDVLVIDVRRKNDHDADPKGIPGSQWRNPADFGAWKEELPKDKNIVVYCQRGGQMSQDIQKHLENTGCKASFLEGGLDAWNKADD